MKHTPAPWEVGSTTTLNGEAVSEIMSGDDTVAISMNYSASDTALIAAAPELLILLKKAQRLGLDMDIGRAYISRAYINEQDSLNAQINALIAKATGAEA